MTTVIFWAGILAGLVLTVVTITTLLSIAHNLEVIAGVMTKF